MFGLVKIKDDRGAVLPLYEEPWARSRRDPAISAALRQVLHTRDGAKVSTVNLLGMMAGGVIAWLGLEHVDSWVRRATSSVVLGVIAGIVFMMGGVVVLSFFMMDHAKWRVRAALLKLWRCPSCGYSLGELKVEEDGCVVCSECGGAWRTRR